MCRRLSSDNYYCFVIDLSLSLSASFHCTSARCHSCYDMMFCTHIIGSFSFFICTAATATSSTGISLHPGPFQSISPYQSPCASPAQGLLYLHYLIISFTHIICISACIYASQSSAAASPPQSVLSLPHLIVWVNLIPTPLTICISLPSLPPLARPFIFCIASLICILHSKLRLFLHRLHLHSKHHLRPRAPLHYQLLFIPPPSAFYNIFPFASPRSLICTLSLICISFKFHLHLFSLMHLLPHLHSRLLHTVAFHCRGWPPSVIH